MALRAIVGFDRTINAATGISPAAKIPGTPLYNLPHAVTAGGSTTFNRTSDNWLQIQGFYVAGSSNSNPWTKTVGCVLPLKEVLPQLSAKTVMTFGVRLKSPSAGHAVSLQDSADSTLPTFAIFGTTGLGDGVLGTAGNNREYYLEATLDIEKKTAYRWIDGVAIANVVIPDWVVAKFTNNQAINTVFGYPYTYAAAPGASQVVNIRDIYVLEKTDDGIASERLGPQVVKPLTLTAFDATNWTNNGSGSNLDAVKTAVTTVASLSAPLVTSDADENPATVKFSAAGIGAKINGIVLTAEAKRTAASDTRLTTTLTEGSAVANGTTVVLSDAVDNYLPFYVAARSPAGNKFTKSIVEALAVKVQPTSGA